MSAPGQHDESNAAGGRAAGDTDWAAVTGSPPFRSLVAAKTRFLVPAVAFYLVFYLGVTALAGFAPGLMAAKVVGSLNVGYVLILATYAMAWIMSVVYVRIAGRSFDPKTEAAIADLDASRDRP